MEPARRIEGPEGAPLVVMHADFSCPDCALALSRLDAIGVRIDLRHFVLRSRGEPARRAAFAAEAADVLGGLFWPFARYLLENQGHHDLPQIWGAARRLGVDPDRFEDERRREPGATRIAAETRAALVGGATGVPGVFADEDAAGYLRANGYDGEVRIRSKK